MPLRIVPKEKQATGAFNGGEIVENKPIGFPQEGGLVRPYSNLFYWAFAEATTDSTIGLHPHEGFEILSFVLKGNIRHYDTKLQSWRPLQAGDVQVIRAGNGISHSEFMADGSAMFQIWFDPDLSKTLQQPPSYDDYRAEQLPLQTEKGLRIKTYIGKNSPVTLDTPGLEVHRFFFDNGGLRLLVTPDKICSIYVISGQLVLNGEQLQPNDFVIAKDLKLLDFDVPCQADVFQITSVATAPYRTYSQLMARR